MNNMLLRLGVCFLLLTTLAFAQSSFWVPTAGPLRISVSAMAINSHGDVFAGTYTLGMYCSTDNGGSWIQMNNGLPDSRIYSIAVSKAQGNFDYIFVATRASGIFRSTNNGATWTPAGLADTSTYIESLTLDLDGNLFASSHQTYENISTMYRSTDNGVSWQVDEIDNPLVHTNIPFILVPTMGTLTGQVFAGSNWGVYRSQDDGQTWGRVVPVGTNFQVNSFAVNFRGDMYAAATDSAVYKSTDDGQSWNKVGVTNDKVVALAITPNGVLFAAIYGGGVFRSLDDGATWQSLDSGLEGQLMLSLVYVDAGPYNTYMYAGGTGLGTYISRNSTTPFSLNRYAIYFGDVKVGASKIDSIVVTNRDTTDLAIYEPISIPKYFTITPSDTVIPVGGSAKFYVTFHPTMYGDYRGLATFVSSANSSPDEVLIFGTGRAPDTRLVDSTIFYGRVFLGSYSDMSVKIKNIGNDTLRFIHTFTSDSVFTVRLDTNNVLPGNFAVVTVRFTPRFNGPYVGFAVLQSNSYSTPDTIWLNGYGRGFPKTVFSLNEIMFGNVKIGREKDTSMSVTNIGVDTLWFSRIYSNNTQFGVKMDLSPMPPGAQRRFTVKYTPFTKGEVFGTIYFYSNTLSSPDSLVVYGLGDPNTNIQTLPGIPTDYILYQNFPNPFNPATTIRFGIPTDGGVKMTLYNVIGQEVALITDEVLPAGYYEAHFQNPGLPSGIYFYNMIVSSVRPDDDQTSDQPIHTTYNQFMKMVIVK